jgi:hypothetical protein
MEVLHPHCAGLDLHKYTVVSCVRHMVDGKVTTEVRIFRTATHELMTLSGWLSVEFQDEPDYSAPKNESVRSRCLNPRCESVARRRAPTATSARTSSRIKLPGGQTGSYPETGFEEIGPRKSQVLWDLSDAPRASEWLCARASADTKPSCYLKHALSSDAKCKSASPENYSE